MLIAKNISSYYGNIQALDNISIEVNKGEIVSIIGSNGAGKSTLLMTLCGASFRLLTIGVILGTLNLTDKLGEVLHVGAEGSKLGLNSFNRHYIFLTRLIFKSRKKYIVAMVTINHNRNIKTRLSTVK